VTTPDIRTRLQLAAERLSQLGEESESYLAYARQRGSGGMTPETSLATITVHPLDPPSPRLAALAGEVVYHLRSALDFGVYAAAFVDSGTPQRDTQFPLISDERNWDAEATRRLKGVAPWRREIVRALQPFNGELWGTILRDLSNPDKHRRLTVVAAEAEHKLTVKRTAEGFESVFEPTVLLTLEHGGELVPTLSDLLTEVTTAITRLLVTQRDGH
jgi:hypothetical protein